MIKREFDIDVSSNPANGSQNLSSDGSSFEVNYEGSPPLALPLTAKNISVSVKNAEIWWTVPNVISGQNDAFRLTDTGAGSGTAFGPTTINIPQGLYDLSGLAQTIERELVSAGAASGTISFSADNATQKVEITANFVGITIDFTVTNSVRDILGFNSQVLGPTAVAPTIWLADNVAAFNVVNYFLIHGDVCDKGIPINSSYTNILAKVVIDVSPGSQIIHRPFRPSRCGASKLKGTTQTNFRYWLTDDQNRAVNTNNEYWSATLSVKYEIPEKISD
jgi:hypothetical protein